MTSLTYGTIGRSADKYLIFCHFVCITLHPYFHRGAFLRKKNRRRVFYDNLEFKRDETPCINL